MEFDVINAQRFWLPALTIANVDSAQQSEKW